MDFDKDLQSIQEVRWLVAKAVVAQKELAKMSQQQVDGIAKAIADAVWRRWPWRKPDLVYGRIRY